MFVPRGIFKQIIKDETDYLAGKRLHGSELAVVLKWFLTLLMSRWDNSLGRSTKALHIEI